MRVAVCYSGQLRTGPACVKNHLAFLEGIDVDFFAHTWSYNTDKKLNLLKAETPVPQHILDLWQTQIPFKAIAVDDQSYAPHRRNDAGHISLYESWLRSINLKRQYENQTGIRYDAVVKLRPDILLNPLRRLTKQLEIIKDTRKFLVELFTLTQIKLWYDDTVWLSSSQVMDEIVDWYEKNRRNGEYGDFSESFKDLGVTVAPSGWWGFDYAIMRKGCVGMDPVKDYQKIWRYDEVWKRRAKPLPEPLDYYDPSLVYNKS